MATVPMVGETRFLIEEVSWEAYEALLKCWASRSKRMTYDRGRLEFMSPLLSHENYGSLICQLVWAYTLERRIPRHSGRSTTLKRESEQRGLEPDDCFWIQNEPRMRGRQEFDPEQDPPPDLAIEIDITSSSLPRMSIYATLGVPEVWRFDGSVFTINLLRDGAYQESDRGQALPAMTTEVVTRFLSLGDQMGEVELMTAFIDWIREDVSGEAPRKSKRPRKK